MKRDLITPILNAVLVFFLLLAAVLCIQYVFIAREVRRLSIQAANINNSRPALQALALECLEYSKKNPALVPVLESLNIRAPQAAPTNAGKPPAR